MKKLRLIMGKVHREVSAFKRYFPEIKEDIHVPSVRKVSRVRRRKGPTKKEVSDLDREIDSIKAKLEKLNV